MYAFRGILSHIGVVASPGSNIATDATNDILQSENEEHEPMFVATVNNEYDISRMYLSPYIKNVCCYIAGFVVRKLIGQLRCPTCRELLISTELISNDDLRSYQFLQLKDKGGLVTPSPAVLSIVQVTEKVLRSLVTSIYELSRNSTRVESIVLPQLQFAELFPNNNHMAETVEGIDNHVYSLVRQIVRFYLVIRSNHYVQSFNTESRVSVRQTLNKLVLFKNQ